MKLEILLNCTRVSRAYRDQRDQMDMHATDACCRRLRLSRRGSVKPIKLWAMICASAPAQLLDRSNASRPMQRAGTVRSGNSTPHLFCFLRSKLSQKRPQPCNQSSSSRRRACAPDELAAPRPLRLQHLVRRAPLSLP